MLPFFKKILTNSHLCAIIKLFQTEHFFKGRGKTMTTERKTALLRETALFAAMSAQTEKTLTALPTTGFETGAVIDTGLRLAVVLAGKVSIYGKDGKGSVLLNRVGPGEIFGAAGVFCDKMSAVTVPVASAKCELLLLDRETLESILQTDFSVACAYIGFLSEKIHFLNRKIASFTASRSDEALAEYLLRHADETGRVTVNRARLASILNVGRTTLYRAMDLLVARGAIRTVRGGIEILDRTMLSDRAGNAGERIKG